MNSFMNNPQIISKEKLLKAKRENVIRLARALKIEVQGQSFNRIVGLVAWHVAQPVRRFAETAKRDEYQFMWENLG